MSWSPSGQPAKPEQLALVVPIPSDHAYVQHLTDPGPDQHFLTAPDRTAPPSPGTWTPSPAFDPAFWAAAPVEIGAVHLHFGYEHLTPDQVTAWAGQVRRRGHVLVVTVHDLTNPHLADQARHLACVEAAVAAADHVITLTPGAAAEIRQRWNREATVLPHPHLMPLELVGTRHRPRNLDRPRIGVPLGVLRANVAFDDVLRLVGGRTDIDVQLRVGAAVMAAPTTSSPGHGADRAGRLRAGARSGDWELLVVPPAQPEESVWQWLSSLDAVLLPYAWGSHSGWAEACADVGTSVIAPTVGYWHEQRPLIALPELSRARPADLTAAVARLRDRSDPVGGGLLPVERPARRAERERLHRAHAALYRAWPARPVC